jgi:hypothetical protein
LKYFYLEPEVAGGYGEGTVLDTSVRPERVERLHYEFQGWLGDDLLEAFPVFIITDRLKKRLQPLHASGYFLDQVRVSKGPQFRELHPSAPALPPFHWLKITGRAGVEDFGLAQDRRLVVSERVLQVLRSANLNHCDIEGYPQAAD